MTRKLYYEDCHINRFQAQVIACEESPKGYEVRLDATAFYPEGGGQACGKHCVCVHDIFLTFIIWSWLQSQIDMVRASWCERV